MSARLEKILALQFKYFGDAVVLTPALRALRGHFPGSDLHLLVPAELAPLFQPLPWLARVWPMPRQRGRAGLRTAWPLIRALRAERFDRCVDFGSNDRGAILSLLSGARRRLAWGAPGGFPGRRWCYTERVAPGREARHESIRLAGLLAGWQVPLPDDFTPEIRPDPALAGAAAELLPGKGAVICHVASSQPKKEWPLAAWVEFHRQAAAAGYSLVFTTPQGAREAGLMAELGRLAPAARILPALPGLALFLAVLSRGAVFISGDTGPLHFAAGLGLPTVGLFGPSAPELWAPLGPRHQVLRGGVCGCDGHSAVCLGPRHCLAEISPEQALQALRRQLPAG